MTYVCNANASQQIDVALRLYGMHFGQNATNVRG